MMFSHRIMALSIVSEAILFSVIMQSPAKVAAVTAAELPIPDPMGIEEENSMVTPHGRSKQPLNSSTAWFKS